VPLGGCPSVPRARRRSTVRRRSAAAGRLFGCASVLRGRRRSAAAVRPPPFGCSSLPRGRRRSAVRRCRAPAAARLFVAAARLSLAVRPPPLGRPSPPLGCPSPLGRPLELGIELTRTLASCAGIVDREGGGFHPHPLKWVGVARVCTENRRDERERARRTSGRKSRPRCVRSAAAVRGQISLSTSRSRRRHRRGPCSARRPR
jgi:hypothetical protein